jgi:predicted Na+-dependent transporter
VIGVGTLLGEEGNVPACVLGAFLGGLAGIFAEPILYTLSGSEPLDPQLEALGMAAVAFLPAIGATIGFNHPLP